MLLRRITCFFIVILISASLHAQFSDSFDDGDFTADPVWQGTPDAFIINNDLQLQSNVTTTNTSFYLSTASTLATVADWEFWLKLDFNTSSANYVDIWLTASHSDLEDPENSGYFVRIGNTHDEISLYRQSAHTAPVEIIDGLDGELGSSNTLKIRVTRDASNNWVLYRDLTGTGDHYFVEGSVPDDAFQTSQYFGVLVKQSTASFFQKHFFDDFVVKTYIPDTTPPVLVSASATSSTTIDVLFDEPLDPVSATILSHYDAGSPGFPASVTLDAQNSALVHLTFENPFVSAQPYTLTVNGVKDISGNAISNGTATFSFYIPQKYDVVINELFPDPSPQIGLPDKQYLELTNVSEFPINLLGWKLIDKNGDEAVLPSYELKPDSFLLICAANSVAAFTGYGDVVGVSRFPTLNITGGIVVLRSATGVLMHAVSYTKDSYRSEVKRDGGYSLEMIDPRNPCGGRDNWTASNDPSGGTPNRKNSVEGTFADDTPPEMSRAWLSGTQEVTIVFNEPLDSTSAADIGHYSINNGLQAISAQAKAPFFKEVVLSLQGSLSAGTIYNIIANGVSDCAGNSIVSKNEVQFGIAQSPDSLDVVVNEILFNPTPQSVDYVELYNRSSKIIDLSGLYLANRSSDGSLNSVTRLTDENRLLFPGKYICLTSSIAAVLSQYITTDPDAFLQMNSFPSYPDAAGSVILLDAQGILDEVDYSDKWHFATMANTEGVSLERINPDGPSTKDNFHSAASTVGHGTPGYQNSQYGAQTSTTGMITITPEVFSPDNDGHDDFLTIHYQFPKPGFLTNIRIFDAAGRPVRFLENNSLSGTEGYYRWDGLDDHKQKLPQGMYIIFTEILNVDGTRKVFKNTIVLARKY